ncbi:MAG: lipocalin [Elusimicrobia bacterium]|nr:lipocalin [Elusimicrobiota bacterium]
MFALCAGACLLLLCACSAPDSKLAPVNDFELSRYLGTWHEIARLDNSFEKGLSKVTAEYALRPDGKVAVANKGFNAKKQKWETATAVAKFAGDSRTGALKVSFFRPFYGHYLILELDRENYSYALVSGGNTGYLWILSRSKTLDPKTLGQLLAKANALGFDTAKLVFPEQ